MKKRWYILILLVFQLIIGCNSNNSTTKNAISARVKDSLDAIMVEEREWVNATSVNSLKIYQKYVSLFPDGRHTKEALIKIDDSDSLMLMVPMYVKYQGTLYTPFREVEGDQPYNKKWDEKTNYRGESTTPNGLISQINLGNIKIVPENPEINSDGSLITKEFGRIELYVTFKSLWDESSSGNTILIVKMPFKQIRKILSMACDTKKKLNIALKYAIAYDQCRIVKYLLENGADPNYQHTEIRFGNYQQSNISMLVLAVKNHSIEIIKLLLDKGADPNRKYGGDFQQHRGDLPLQEAIFQYWENEMGIIELLLSRGADINIKDSWGRTPLAMAVFTKNYKVAKYLLEQKANPNLRDLNGASPLYEASRDDPFDGNKTRKEQIIQLLKQYGAK